jgi:hypothetical protein
MQGLDSNPDHHQKKETQYLNHIPQQTRSRHEISDKDLQIKEIEKITLCEITQAYCLHLKIIILLVKLGK